MERGYSSALAVAGHVLLMAFFTLDIGEVEHAFKMFKIRECFGEQKIEERPEFGEIILEWCPGEYNARLGRILFEFFDKFTVEVL